MSEVRFPRFVVFFLLAFCAILFFHGLSGPFYRTEGLRALLAAEFLRSGNWLVPTLYGEPLLTKPPGAYAAIALASTPFGGVHEWTARLPSALAACLLVLLFYRTFRHILGRGAGLIAALALPTSFAWLERVPSAEIDVLQVAWVSAALLFFLRALERAEDDPPSAGGGWWVAALLCVAGGFLTKWTAPAFFYGTVLPLLWWRGRLRLLLGRAHLLSAALAAALGLTWIAAAVARAGWPAFAETVGREAWTKIVPGQRATAYPWRETFLHPLRLLGAGLPWSAFALFTLRPGFGQLWDERGRRLLQLLHCWTWPNLVFWSIVPGHAARNSFPLVPGLTGLAVLVWHVWLTGRLRWPLHALTARRAFVGLLALWLAVKIAYVHAVMPQRTNARQPRAKGEALAALVPEGRTLYLFRFKDEGILFYYGRLARRLPDPLHLPNRGELVYCIVTAAEWTQWPLPDRTEVVERLQDEQRDPILLVRVATPNQP
jgi:4-amino-4-deoxy-L-arabinose transferase-like glycosyltransferase